MEFDEQPYFKKQTEVKEVRIIEVNGKWELQIHVSYRIGKTPVDKWVTKARGTKRYCENVYLYIVCA